LISHAAFIMVAFGQIIGESGTTIDGRKDTARDGPGYATISINWMQQAVSHRAEDNSITPVLVRIG
jgi:hypothetical protein